MIEKIQRRDWRTERGSHGAVACCRCYTSPGIHAKPGGLFLSSLVFFFFLPLDVECNACLLSLIRDIITDADNRQHMRIAGAIRHVGQGSARVSEMAKIRGAMPAQRRSTRAARPPRQHIEQRTLAQVVYMDCICRYSGEAAATHCIVRRRRI